MTCSAGEGLVSCPFQGEIGRQRENSQGGFRYIDLRVSLMNRIRHCYPQSAVRVERV